MTKFMDLSGKRFGRLTAIERDLVDVKRTKWICKCDCGKVKSILLCSLNSGRSTSCGCYRKEYTSQKFKTHGLTKSRIHGIWTGMKARCNNNEYGRYGGRGIRYSPEWESFEKFHDWAVENGYEENLTLDRIDNDGDYEPSNCRWVDRTIQANNKSINVFVEIRGEILTLSEVAKKYNINYYTIHDRYNEGGLRGEDLIVPVKKTKTVIEYKGEKKSLKAWSRELGFAYETLRHRYNRGLRVPELFGPLDEIASRNARKNKKEIG